MIIKNAGMESLADSVLFLLLSDAVDGGSLALHYEKSVNFELLDDGLESGWVVRLFGNHSVFVGNPAFADMDRALEGLSKRDSWVIDEILKGSSI